MKTLPPCWRLLLALVTLRATAALAHGGLPETTNVSLRRGNDSDLIVGASFGAVISRDSGQTWRWICPEGMGIGAWRPERYFWLTDGDILAATGNSLVRSSDGGCTWSMHPTFKDTWATSLAVHPTDERIMYVTTGKPYVANSVYRSEDGGQTWTPMVTPNAETRYSVVRIAPSDPRRLYASGLDGSGMFLLRSDDAGQSWTRLPQPLPQFQTPYDFIMVMVSEASPDVLWAKVSAQGYSYLLKSTDGGATMTQVLEVADILIGAEVSADGNTVWAATPVYLYRGREGEAIAPLPLPNGNACAKRSGDVLYGCGSSWVHEWALARSRDEGTTWEPLFRLKDIAGSHVCGESTPVQQACPSRWPQVAATLGSSVATDGGVPSGSDGGTNGPGDGTSPPPPAAKGGCSTASGLAPSALLLLTLGLSRHSRRRQARRD
ncbi:WD40/YVTN/BNR-like repeat-containing protein [Hyalangium rubrum]|uniref:Sortilin N-terminal domain-containing protein n=1 Tax=Hyalangium rubrum TaxID=3103134 RepID=A0ABU5H9B9_9BACT|nr:hypothetical protein [Hyalangium sp. s54d21]MDY7230074.1 hypothetical protein [Hyalangium sp. s54d21]